MPCSCCSTNRIGVQKKVILDQSHSPFLSLYQLLFPQLKNGPQLFVFTHLPPPSPESTPRLCNNVWKRLICRASGYQVALQVNWQRTYPATLLLRRRSLGPRLLHICMCSPPLKHKPLLSYHSTVFRYNTICPRPPYPSDKLAKINACASSVHSLCRNWSCPYWLRTVRLGASATYSLTKFFCRNVCFATKPELFLRPLPSQIAQLISSQFPALNYCLHDSKPNPLSHSVAHTSVGTLVNLMTTVLVAEVWKCNKRFAPFSSSWARRKQDFGQPRWWTCFVCEMGHM